MAIPIKRTEKDFLLSVLYNEHVPLKYLRDRREYILTVDKPVRKELFLKPDQPIKSLKIKDKMELMFKYQGQAISFTVEAASLENDKGNIIAVVPEFLYKNLDRSYSRINAPPDLDVQFTYFGDRYNLAFPKLAEYEKEEIGDFVKKMDPKNLAGLIEQMGAWLKTCADGYKFVIFKDVKPASREERLIAETGKALYLPSTQGEFPDSDPHPKKRLITAEMFRQHEESSSAITRFLKGKFNRGILSDLWVPILFQEYVIGYIHTWVSGADRNPFDYTVVDTLFQFAAVLSYSFYINGFFENGKVTDTSFEGKVIDVSASGLLFTYPNSGLASTLLPDTELLIQLSALKRSIGANAKIVRRCRDNSHSYFGCHFLDMAPEDTRFLFEFLYGKSFTDTDAAFLSGRL
ncbi:hypothetical protein FACS1894109_10240 [Spirochaetia bacterium]|nr:hypothetical protein FACS1894109_10240 [Spirochaetia bacterium]